ncbi:hypothetical protein VOLCADRAFT_100520 [Volvox carteri f. nagariensis]|uniref:Uncharacterized protein n=1 Tax=Volvox carteri f. nagariensis TaxID=3068 RepID=D8UKD7_VOLCA|nr:uncharacterized protein VOLCADRAFT_100520 [Volvox carteri f. nagariensis]EFJ39804.1 hypothetical protein VOLCADRAFT_100520 [Volvox carteri f. nagariensis]|eukprot:XP_002959123.1 hypothetical protein VOLCADRAFT_100520 [Volvox carteri f. nagariensis]
MARVRAYPPHLIRPTLVAPTTGLYDTVEGLSYFVRCTHPALELTTLTTAQQGCVYDDECLEVRPVWRNSLLWQRASAAAAALRAAYDTVSRGKEEAPPSVSEASWDLGSCSTASTTACDDGEEAEESPKRTSGSSGGGTGSSSSSKGGVPESGGDSSSDVRDGGAAQRSVVQRVYGVVRHGRAASGGGAAAAAAVVCWLQLSAAAVAVAWTCGNFDLEGVRRTAAAAAAAAATPSSTVAARRVTLPGLQPPPPSSTRQPPPPLPQPSPQRTKATRPPDDNPLAYLLYLKHTRQAVLVVAAGDLAAVRSLAAHPVSKLLRRAPSGLLLAVTHVAAAEVTWQRRYRQLAERQLPGPHVWPKPAATAAATAAAEAVPPPPLAGLGHLGSARVTMRLNAVAPATFPLPFELRVRQCAAAGRRGVANEDVRERGVDAVDRQLEDNIAAATAATATAMEPAAKPAALREVVSNAGDKRTGPSSQPLHGQRQQLQPPPRALAEPEDRPQLQLVAERDEPREGTEPAATATTVVGNGHVAAAAAAAAHRPMGRKANGDRRGAAGIITQRRNAVKSRVASLLDTLTATCVVVQHGGGGSGGGGGGTGGKSRGFLTSDTDDDSSSSSSSGSGSGGEQQKQTQIQKAEKKHECQRLVAAAVLVHWWDDGPGDGGGGGGRMGNEAAAAADLVPEQMLPPVAEVQRRLFLERRDTGLLQMLQAICSTLPQGQSSVKLGNALFFSYHYTCPWDVLVGCLHWLSAFGPCRPWPCVNCVGDSPSSIRHQPECCTPRVAVKADPKCAAPQPPPPFECTFIGSLNRRQLGGPPKLAASCSC